MLQKHSSQRDCYKYSASSLQMLCQLLYIKLRVDDYRIIEWKTLQETKTFDTNLKHALSNKEMVEGFLEHLNFRMKKVDHNQRISISNQLTT